MDRTHGTSTLDVPGFTALVWPHPQALQLRAHRTIHEQHAARMQPIEEARHFTPHICPIGRRGPSPTAADTSLGIDQAHHADIATRQTPLQRLCGTTALPAPPAPDASC